MAAVWVTQKCFFKGKSGWDSPAESTWLSPSSGRSVEAMSVETLKCGSSGRLPAAPGTAAEQGRCLLFCALGLFNIFPPPPLFSPQLVAIRSEAGQLPAQLLGRVWQLC